MRDPVEVTKCDRPHRQRPTGRWRAVEIKGAMGDQVTQVMANWSFLFIMNIDRYFQYK